MAKSARSYRFPRDSLISAASAEEEALPSVPSSAPQTLVFRKDDTRSLMARMGDSPFALPVGEILARLERANAAQGWNLGEAVFQRLRATVPTVPEGRLMFLSLRIRFGTGQKGVEETFEAHAAEIWRVHGEKKFWRWEYLRSDKEHLRLLAGNETHAPIVEWCVIDLGANRDRQSITAVRGPNSLADDGLVLAWLYPEYVRAIDYKENPGFFLAGYELNVPEFDGGPWRHVPLVNRDLVTGKVELSAYWHSYANSDYSAPLRRE